MDTDAFVAGRRALRMPELEQSFIRAMKDSKWADALRFAQTALELDPGCKKYVDFIPLLEEKLGLGNEEDDNTVEGGEDTENDYDDDDDDNDDEDDEEEEEEEQDDAEEEDDGEELADQDPEIKTNHAATHPDMIVEHLNPSRLNKEQRGQLRAVLESGIKNLKEKEVIEKLSLDPLLGA